MLEEGEFAQIEFPAEPGETLADWERTCMVRLDDGSRRVYVPGVMGWLCDGAALIDGIEADVDFCLNGGHVYILADDMVRCCPELAEDIPLLVEGVLLALGRGLPQEEDSNSGT